MRWILRCHLPRAVVIAVVVSLLGALMVVTSAVSTAWAAPATPADRPSVPLSLQAPVPGTLTRGFDPPEQAWGRGHRGVDLDAAPGTVVRASADGVVSFAGRIAGRGVVSITHHAPTKLRTTYEPLDAQVRPGQRVRAGDVIGTVAQVQGSGAGHQGLHWGLIEGERYLDPMAALGEDGGKASAEDVRLLPRQARPRPQPKISVPTVTPGPGLPAAAGSGSTRPADGPVTSRFGMRRHPVLGVWKLHDGLDIGAPCRAPVRSAMAGTVVLVERHVAYGVRVIVDHGGQRTGYAHLSAVSVTSGSKLAAGQQLGQIGTTGWSTGCHLHLMLWSGGAVVDPAPLLR